MKGLSLRGVVIALFPILAVGGCRGCFCTNAAKSLGEKPPDDVVLDGAKKGVESPSALRTLCGIRVAGLRDLALTILETPNGEHKVRVSGVAIPYEAGTADEDAGTADDDAGPADEDEDEDASANTDASVGVAASGTTVTDPMKALVCTGVVLVTITAVLDRDGTRKGWRSSGFAIDSVLTPGVVFEKAKPSTPHGGHRRRRHHHHH